MSIPEECTVLVVGGGPAGSYAATVLAREGINTVLLEADVFPRYHIGESMLPSLRHFLRFIDLDSTFVNYGFTIKAGAFFKFNAKREGFTDFGKENFAWNVVRSEADELMFRHAGKSGAKIFDGVKVDKVDFVPFNSGNTVDDDSVVAGLGRPVSATYSRKESSSGTINFEYLIDASGRSGLVSTKYLKNRKFNQGLKNVAMWGYWKGADTYMEGKYAENSPFFEALQDESGWAWFIPLHNGTISVGIVMRQDLSIAKKKAMSSPSSHDFYTESLKLVPTGLGLLSKAELVTDVKNASDYSYSASSYAHSYLRVIGDAGCFIDPFFSSGVHLALASALSAATTICASIKGQCDEQVAAKWHTDKVTESYTRFLIVVLAAYKQIRQQDEPILSDFDEDGFDKAFNFFKPIIQGTADVSASNKLTQEELSRTIDFCFKAYQPPPNPEEVAAVRRKLEAADIKHAGLSPDAKTREAEAFQEKLSIEELSIVQHVTAKEMTLSDSFMNLDKFSGVNGLSPNLERGSLGLSVTSTIGTAGEAGGDMLTRLKTLDWE